MNILIIGNGFDLAHKLPTSYIDFLRYEDKNKHVNGNKWLEYFIYRMNINNIIGNNWIDLEREIRDAVTSVIEIPRIDIHDDERIELYKNTKIVDFINGNKKI